MILKYISNDQCFNVSCHSLYFSIFMACNNLVLQYKAYSASKSLADLEGACPAHAPS